MSIAPRWTECYRAQAEAQLAFCSIGKVRIHIRIFIPEQAGNRTCVSLDIRAHGTKVIELRRRISDEIATELCSEDEANRDRPPLREIAIG